MDIDIARLLRLRATIRSAIEGGEKSSTSQGVILVKLFAAVYAELRSIIPQVMAEELERVVPKHQFGGSETWQDHIDAENAKLMLRTLTGWIDGVVEEAQFAARLSAEAEAYAQARVKAERPIGFKP